MPAIDVKRSSSIGKHEHLTRQILDEDTGEAASFGAADTTWTLDPKIAEDSCDIYTGANGESAAVCESEGETGYTRLALVSVPDWHHVELMLAEPIVGQGGEQFNLWLDCWPAGDPDSFIEQFVGRSTVNGVWEVDQPLPFHLPGYGGPGYAHLVAANQYGPYTGGGGLFTSTPQSANGLPISVGGVGVNPRLGLFKTVDQAILAIPIVYKVTLSASLFPLGTEMVPLGITLYEGDTVLDIVLETTDDWDGGSFSFGNDPVSLDVNLIAYAGLPTPIISRDYAKYDNGPYAGTDGNLSLSASATHDTYGRLPAPVKQTHALMALAGWNTPIPATTGSVTVWVYVLPAAATVNLGTLS